jgi:hypothetical protein
MIGSVRRIFSCCTLALAAFLLAQPCLAGPPYLTDDPVPVDYGHWEINIFSTASFVDGTAAGAMSGVDANYGAAPNLQLHFQPLANFSQTPGVGNYYGLGDIEFGVKYRFIEAKDSDWWPQIGIYPLLDLPTGDADRGLGTGRAHAFLPIWIEKDFDKWTTYGGGGYWINPGPGNRSYWFAGWVLQRQVTDVLAIGGEIYHGTQSATGGPGAPGFPIGSQDSTGFNLGATYDFNATYHLLVSAGRGVPGLSSTDDFAYYVALRCTF